MSASFDFPDVDQFLCGTIGPPGRRTFYLQAVAGDVVVAVKLEKQQVALLADYLDRLTTAHELPSGPQATCGDLLQPVIPEWVVGALMVAINEATSRIVVIARELDESGEANDEPPGSTDLAELRVALTPSQVEAFIETARELMAGGRPACRLCGRPVDPEGHACPRWN